MRSSSDKYFCFWFASQIRTTPDWVFLLVKWFIILLMAGAMIWIPFYVLLLSLEMWQFVAVWFGGLYVYFSICICNVFNLMIIVLYIGEKFSFCVFLVVVIYRVVFCHDVKHTPYIWILLCWLSVYAANDIFSFWCESRCD